MEDNTEFQLLNKLIEPLSLSSFFEAYYEQKCLHITDRANDYYQDILTVKDIDEALSLKNIPAHSIRMAQLEITSFSEWTKLNMFEGLSVDYEEVQTKLEAGISLLLNSLQKYIPKLRQFVSQFRVELQSMAWTNIYITPPNNQAFKLHYDTHDVFILQIQGTKIWKLYNSPVELPHKSQKFKKLFPEEEHDFPLAQEITLREGDLLYIPRGFLHQAISNEEVSIHITLGITPVRVLDLWDEFKKKSLQEAFFRKSLPVVGLDKHVLEENIKEYFYEVIKQMPLEELLENTQSRWVEKELKIPIPRIIQNLVIKNKIDKNTIIYPRKDVIIKTYVEGYFMVLELNGTKKEFPILLRETIDSLLNAKEGIKIKDLKGPFSEIEKIKLIKSYIKDNFFTIHHPG